MSVVSVNDADGLPPWRRPEALLMLMALAMPLAFSVWMAMFNNFAYEIAKFDGEDVGVVQAIREIPGFLSFLVIYILLALREQTLAICSLLLLGFGAAITGYLPSFWGLALTTLISSIGFHYFEAVNQSLQLQWLTKDRAPIVLGRIAGVGSSTAFIAFGLVWFYTLGDGRIALIDYEILYLLGGVATMLLALVAWLGFPRFAGATAQRREFVLKKRYWLYYAFVFLSGARRQIFIVFAAFMMVQQFGFELHEMATLLIINHAVNVFFAPMMGRAVARFGERWVLSFEYIGLILVFGAYAFVASGVVVVGALAVAALYIIDHLFFGLHFAQRTYLQKIADPEDMAPTAAVAFTINHIAAVALPWPLGVLYITAPEAVFAVGVALAVLSLALARLTPRRPAKGHETICTPMAAQAAE